MTVVEPCPNIAEITEMLMLLSSYFKSTRKAAHVGRSNVHESTNTVTSSSSGMPLASTSSTAISSLSRVSSAQKVSISHSVVGSNSTLTKKGTNQIGPIYRRDIKGKGRALPIH